MELSFYLSVEGLRMQLSNGSCLWQDSILFEFQWTLNFVSVSACPLTTNNERTLFTLEGPIDFYHIK